MAVAFSIDLNLAEVMTSNLSASALTEGHIW